MTMYMPQSAIPPLSSLDDARRQLTPERRRRPAALKMLAAAAILALSTFLLAGSVILGPFWQTKDSPVVASDQALGR
jgi:small neutral amino acid transporter SnatA (MarC family)